MNFDIITGKEDISVKLISTGEIMEREVGKCHLNLEDYVDQYRHENEWIKLDKGGKIKF